MSHYTHPYINQSFTQLPHPGNGSIPFHVQPFPIPDPLQKHMGTAQRDVVDSAYNKSNSLALGRFLGTVWPQQNQPHFLGANERVVFEDAW
jgi:hypothetical protein